MNNLYKRSFFLNKVLFYIGYFIFICFGKTPRISYMAFINLYCLSNGKFLERLNKNNNYNIKIGNFSKHFEDLSNENIKAISKERNIEGYKVFEQKLNNDIVNDLVSLSYNLKSKIGGNYISFDPKRIESNIYKFNPKDLIKNHRVQELIMDPVLINIAGQYLESEPIFDFAAMWWSTDFKIIREDAAQDYHFDLDRTKWLKIFIYLSDVNTDNGPHCYISGSHKVGNKPQETLDKGYVRINDKELLKFYNKNDFKEVTGPAGTVLFGDTSCWHKGKPIVKGDRLILQLEYTSSLFGSNIPKFELESYSNRFRDFCNDNKFYSQNVKLI